MHLKHLVTLLVLTALLLGVAGVTAQNSAGRSPLTGPCSPGPTYDPACDVNHDGTLDISDIQLAAGHWSQSGTWTSDNNHTHLGQTWTGNDTPLTIQGSFGASPAAPLALSNDTGDGLRIESAGAAGVRVSSATTDGLFVDSAGANGLVVTSAGAAGVRVASTTYDGFYVGTAGGNGLTVNAAGASGVYVDSATYDGVEVNAAGGTGVYAHTTQATGEWGVYTPDKIHGSNVTLASVSLLAQVSGPDGLTPGDLVAAAGVADPLPGSTVHIPQVCLAGGAYSGIIGVVESRMALTPRPGAGTDDTSGKLEVAELRRADGPARAGDYVALTVLGAAQVRVDADAAIEAGQRLTVGDRPGRVRALRSKDLDGMLVIEGAPVIGVALESHTPGTESIWVMVRPQ